MPEEKIICHTPTPGKKPTAIPAWKYHAIRQAILEVVPKKAPGVVAKDLPSLVAKQLSKDIATKLGSIGWHTTTVKLNMEVEGELCRIPKVRPQHLLKT